MRLAKSGLSAPFWGCPMLTRLHVCRRWFLAASLALMAAPTLAEPLPKVKFTLDWRFEGPSAPFLLAKAKGYFQDRKSTRLNSSHITISYAVFCLKKKK